MLGQPIQKVECDKCGEVGEFEMTSLANGSWDNRKLASEMEQCAWVTRGKEHFCPECAEVMSETET